MTSFGGRVWFAADDGGGATLWSSDGPPAGTLLLDDFLPGSSYASPKEVVLSDGLLLTFGL